MSTVFARPWWNFAAQDKAFLESYPKRRESGQWNDPQSTPVADTKSHLIFTLHTLDLLLHGVHVRTSSDLYEWVRWNQRITHQKDVTCSGWHFTFSNKSHAQRGNLCFLPFHLQRNSITSVITAPVKQLSMDHCVEMSHTIMTSIDHNEGSWKQICLNEAGSINVWRFAKGEEDVNDRWLHDRQKWNRLHVSRFEYL